MFEATVSIATGVLALTITLMILTFPAWLAGKLVAMRTRTLPVPVIFRMKLVRWTVWSMAGIIALAGIVLATRPTGTSVSMAQLILVAIALVAYATSAVSAFYLSWTASAQRRSKKARDGSDPTALVQGLSTTPGEGPVRLASEGGRTSDTYVPAKPSIPPGPADDEGDLAYKPARPAE